MWISIHFHIPTYFIEESRGFLWIHVMCFVTGYLENLGFPVDFLRKKFPDAVTSLPIYKIYIDLYFDDFGTYRNVQYIIH